MHRDNDHEEADVTMVSSAILRDSHCNVVYVTADDTDVFLLLMYFFNHTKLPVTSILDTLIAESSMSMDLGPKCSELLEEHAIT